MNALILIDIQNDFCPGGALEVSNGNQVVAIANRLQKDFELVIATQDWHPGDHESFAAQHDGKNPGELVSLHGLDQVLWPIHCVQGSLGAQFHSGLETNRIETIFRKGTDKTIDSYSGFYDNGKRKATGMAGYLRERAVKTVTVLGLATDYCVKFTALDAIAEGFSVRLVEAGCRAVNLASGDGEKAVAEMASAGIEMA